MLSQKIKKGFGPSEVSTLTPADASGLTVWTTNTGTHKIDGSTLKPFSMIQAIRSGEARLFFEETFLVIH